MKTVKVVKATKVACLLLALSASGSVLAAQWDSLGSKHSDRSGVSSHQRSLPNRSNRKNDRQHDQRNNSGHNKSSTSVNIIVGNTVPASRWRSTYNNNYYYNSFGNFGNRHNKRYNRSYNNSAYIFNNSFGYFPRTVVNTISSPVIIYDTQYVQSYAEPTTVIRHNTQTSSVILFKDRYGQCFEKETDRYGQEIKRQIADYNCDF